MAFVAFALIASAGAAVASSPSVDFGDISHKGLKDLGPASTGLKLSLELGLIADQQGIANAVKAASNPSSSSYGDYLSLSTLQQKYGATSSRRNAVVGAFKTYGVTATVDVTHLRVSATISVGNAQKLFGTKWNLYATGESNQAVALPVNTPKLGSGLAGNVDTVSGLGLYVTTHVSASASASPAGQGRTAAVDGGTPTRTGTIDPGCATTTYPSAVPRPQGCSRTRSSARTGSRRCTRSGLKGQGIRVAILGEAPTPTDDVTAYRNCFGFQGTALTIHGGSGITPILESSLDAMTLSMVAPKLARLDLWVKAARPERSSGRARAAGRAAAGDDERHSAAERDLDLLRHLRGERQALHAPRARSSTASWPRPRRSGSRRSSRRATAARRRARTACRPPSSTASTSRSRPPGRRRRPGCSQSAARTSRSRRRTRSSPPGCGTTRSTRRRTSRRPRAGAVSARFEDRPWWQPATSSQKTYRMVPDVAAFADPSPGYVIICSHERSGLRPVVRPDDRVRRRHECGHAARRRDDRALGPAGPASPAYPGRDSFRRCSTRSPTITRIIPRHHERKQLGLQRTCRAARRPAATTWHRGSAPRSPTRSPSSCITDRTGRAVEVTPAGCVVLPQQEVERRAVEGLGVLVQPRVRQMLEDHQLAAGDPAVERLGEARGADEVARSERDQGRASISPSTALASWAMTASVWARNASTG